MSNNHSDEHLEHQREEQALHQAHEQEEQALHQAHEQIEAELHKVEEQLHQKHVQEEEALHHAHEQEEEKEESDECEVTVEVTYNGVTKSLHVNLDNLAKVALAAAIQLFGVSQNPHLLSLYNETGTELADEKSLRDQGVKKCVLLLLRPGTVKGG